MNEDGLTRDFFSGGSPQRLAPIEANAAAEKYFPKGESRNRVKELLVQNSFTVSERAISNVPQDCQDCEALFVNARRDIGTGGLKVAPPEYSLVVQIGFKDGKSKSVRGWVVKNAY